MDTIVVSPSEFRANMFAYGRMAKSGKTVVVKNKKTKEELFRIERPEKTSETAHLEILKKNWGTWKNLPPDKNRAKLRRLDVAYAKKLRKGLV